MNSSPTGNSDKPFFRPAVMMKVLALSLAASAIVAYLDVRSARVANVHDKDSDVANSNVTNRSTTVQGSTSGQSRSSVGIAASGVAEGIK